MRVKGELEMLEFIFKASLGRIAHAHVEELSRMQARQVKDLMVFHKMEMDHFLSQLHSTSASACTPPSQTGCIAGLQSNRPPKSMAIPSDAKVRATAMSTAAALRRQSTDPRRVKFTTVSV